MTALSRYWTIWRINPTRIPSGYESLSSLAAKTFLQQQMSERTTRMNTDEFIQRFLFSCFRTEDETVEMIRCTQAGLCLRCYVSYPIFNACKKLANLFSGGHLFTYQDLLPFVLNDDGTTMIFLDSDGRIQLTLDKGGNPQAQKYLFFTVEVLRTYKHDATSKVSLESWAYWQTKRHPDIKKFLSEFGFKPLSDWALLNSARTTQLDLLSSEERDYVEVFHAVYRRDRKQQKHGGSQKCPDPLEAQLREMLSLLQERGVSLITTQKLVREFQQIAQKLREYDLWSRRGSPLSQSFEVFNSTEGGYVEWELPDLTSNPGVEGAEEQEILVFLRQQFDILFEQAIAQSLQERLNYLQNSRNYNTFASSLIPGLLYFYRQGISLRKIVPLLGIDNWDKARRILNPGELLNLVRAKTIQSLIDCLLKKAVELGLTTLPPQPDYLRNLEQQVEAFVDIEVFNEAASEMKQPGENRPMNSQYAQKLCCYLEQSAKGV